MQLEEIAADIRNYIADKYPLGYATSKIFIIKKTLVIESAYCGRYELIQCRSGDIMFREPDGGLQIATLPIKFVETIKEDYASRESKLSIMEIDSLLADFHATFAIKLEKKKAKLLDASGKYRAKYLRTDISVLEDKLALINNALATRAARKDTITILPQPIAEEMLEYLV